MTKLVIAVTAACIAVLASALRPSANVMDVPLPLRVISDVTAKPANKALGNQTPRMDYESIDPIRRMLYVAYLGANEVIAFNLDTNKVVAHISGLPGVHGVLAISDLSRLYASATASDQVVSIDERSLAITARTAGGDYPDGIAYDRDDHRIFVSDEHGGTDTVVDVRSNKTVDTIDVGGETGNTQYDPVSRRIYSDVQSRSDIVVIDPKTDKVVARHALPGCVHDHGLQLDVPRRLAFVACDGNARLLLVDLTNWSVLSTNEVGEDPDVIAFDPGLRRLYIAAESGVVAVFEENDRSLRSLGKAFLAEGAHTVAVDPKSHRVYFALQTIAGRAVIRVLAPK